jgi:hypothetical protein
LTGIISVFKMIALHPALLVLLCLLFVVRTTRANTDDDKLALISARLQSADVADTKRCDQADWKKKYNEFHKAMLASPSPKLLVAVPHLSGKKAIMPLFYPL